MPARCELVHPVARALCHGVFIEGPPESIYFGTDQLAAWVIVLPLTLLLAVDIGANIHEFPAGVVAFPETDLLALFKLAYLQGVAVSALPLS